MEPRDYICDCSFCNQPILQGENYREIGSHIEHFHTITCVKKLKERIAELEGVLLKARSVMGARLSHQSPLLAEIDTALKRED